MTEDGFIAISIGHAGLAKIQLICDEIFGSENFVMSLPRITKSYTDATTKITRQHDYVLIYCKNWKNCYYLLYDPSDRISSLEFIKDIYSNEQGLKDLQKFDKTLFFTSPKPLSLIKKIISLYPEKEINVLDFYAGSGSTTCACIELNQLDWNINSFTSQIDTGNIINTLQTRVSHFIEHANLSGSNQKLKIIKGK